jgi:hypothetical protein
MGSRRIIAAQREEPEIDKLKADAEQVADVARKLFGDLQF